LLFSETQNTRIINSKFIDNNVSSLAACIYSYKSFVDVSLSEFKGNQGSLTGCIHIEYGQFNVSHSAF